MIGVRSMSRKRRGSFVTSAPKRFKSQWSRSSFGQMMEATGMKLGEAEPNELSTEPVMFQKQLTNSFKSHARLDKAVQEFCQGLCDYCKDPERFKLALSPTKVTDGADIVVRSAGLESLIRLLLGVGSIQPSIIDILLEKLSEYLCQDADVMEMQQLQRIPHLILNQLRMLDHLVKGKELCAKLMETVHIATPQMKIELVSALPDIIDDSQHDEAAEQLRSLLQTHPKLTSAIVDTLSNLNMANHIVEKVLTDTLNCIESADLSDLPTISQFIMQYVTPKNAQEVITELRDKLRLDFSPLHSNLDTSTPINTKRASTDISDHFVIFDTICSMVRIQKSAADGWMKAIESVTSPKEHRVIDVLVLFILYSIGERRKRQSVETLFVNKICSNCFSDDLMDIVFGSHAKVLADYFPSILVLCDSLLCSSSPSVSSFAASLYERMFLAFDIAYKQEVIGALITHINNGLRAEVDHALTVLLTLVRQHFKAMQRFSILIKAVLDRLEYLSMPQIRRLYDILSILAFSDLDRGAALQDEMHILIRKQLHHSEQKYHHIGVIGAVMLIRQIARSDHDLNILTSQTASSQSSLVDSRQKLALTMLEDVMETCSLSVESMILFCDEMSTVAEGLDVTILSHLSEQVTSAFQDDFLIEVSDVLPTDTGISMKLLHGLDVAEEGSIALNLLPLVMGVGDSVKGVGRAGDSVKGVGGAGDSVKGEAVRGIGAQFHLLRVCEKATNKNLEGIDALLGCPVVLCSEDKLTLNVLEDLSLQRRQDICLSLFHCLNWFRELVCAFSSETDPDMKGKVIQRLRNITELHGHLEKVLAATPGWQPPLVNSTQQPNRKKGKTKGDVTLASIAATTLNMDKDTTTVDKSTESAAGSIDRLKPYFRELDLQVFHVLGFNTLSRTLLDTNMHTEQRDELKLHPPQILFLLEDLHSKISSTFSLFGSKGGQKESAKFSASDLVAVMVDLVPILCDHLDRVDAFFQEQLESNDGIVDMVCSHQDYAHHCLCFHLTLKTLSIFFGWSSFSYPLYREQLHSCVQTLASRSRHTHSEHTLSQLAGDACKYLEGFMDNLPTLTCAHSLAKLAVALSRTCTVDSNVKSDLSVTCGKLLKRAWRPSESVASRKDAVQYLLKYYILFNSDSLSIIEEIVGESVVELIGENALDQATNFPTLTKATFPWYYQVMISTLAGQVKTIPIPKKKNIPTEEELNDRMHLLEVSARVLFMMVNLVKSFLKSPVLSACHKHGRAYVDAFLRTGMPVLHSLFRTKKDDVIALLKNVQQSTRSLQHYCGHSKIVKDTNLINQVPQVKKSLEMFIFKVKELLQTHNCGEAFWLGNLKNRDIMGQEISSQQQTIQAEEEDNEECDGQSVTNSTSTDGTRADYLDETTDYDQTED